MSNTRIHHDGTSLLAALVGRATNSKAAEGVTTKALPSSPIRAAHTRHGIGWLSNRLVKQAGNVLRRYTPRADRTPSPTDNYSAALASRAGTKRGAHVDSDGSLAFVWSTNELICTNYSLKLINYFVAHDDGPKGAKHHERSRARVD
jgi:hypothetical protein